MFNVVETLTGVVLFVNKSFLTVDAMLVPDVAAVLFLVVGTNNVVPLVDDFVMLDVDDASVIGAALLEEIVDAAVKFDFNVV